LGAEKCFQREDEQDTGGYAYELVYEKRDRKS
jgi:hypothetical protein